MFTKSLVAAFFAPVALAIDVVDCASQSSSPCPSTTGNDTVFSCDLIAEPQLSCNDGDVMMTFGYKSEEEMVDEYGVCVYAAVIDGPNGDEILYSKCLGREEINDTCGFSQPCPVAFCAPVTALKSTIRFGIVDRKSPTDELVLPTLSGLSFCADDNHDSQCSSRDTDGDGIIDCDDNFFSLSLDDVVELINTETGERLTAFDAIDEAIGREFSARFRADRDQTNDVLALAAEAAALEAALLSEAVARQEGDDSLAVALGEEADARDAAIVAEQNTRANAVSELGEDISEDIDELGVELTQNITDLDQTIQVEIKEVVAELQSEVDARFDSVADINQDITDLGDLVAEEVTAREEGDAALQTAINNIAASYGDCDGTGLDGLPEQLAEETEAREAGDQVNADTIVVMQEVIDTQQTVILSLQQQIQLLIEELAPEEAICAADYLDMADPQLLEAFKAPKRQGNKACRIVECVPGWYLTFWPWYQYHDCDCRYAVEYSVPTDHVTNYGWHDWVQRESGCINTDNSTTVAQELRSLIEEDYCFGFPCNLEDVQFPIVV